MPRIELPLDKLLAATERFHGFQDLIQKRVQDVLLVATLYDYYILSLDGRLSEQFLGEFLELNLRHTPNLTHAFSGREALERARESGRYDLIITSVELGDMNVLGLTAALRAEGIETPVVVLAYDRRELSRLVERHDVSGIERMFLWQGDVRILVAIVKYMEDKLNVAYDTGVVGVPAIVLVENSIRYYSSFLPVIYTELVKHSHGLLPEGLNLTDKILRIRAVPKILLASDYEEAFGYFERYSEEILGLLSDIQFPREGAIRPDAGFELATEVRRLRPDLPIMLQSSRRENEEKALAMGASFLLKGSPTLMHQVRKFMAESLRIGDFVFRLPDGRELGSASDLRTLEEMLEKVPAESLAYHGKRNDFSTWLRARTELALADKLRPLKVSDFETVEDLRESVITSIAEYRRERNRGQVVDFDRNQFDATASFYRIGAGSLGGKARGLAFIESLLNQFHIDRYFPGIQIAVPSSVVIATEVFDRFLEENQLTDLALQSEADEEVVRAFERAAFPGEIRADLEAFLAQSPFPLAVRSSSLLEDSQYQPFAGVYQTYMLPNANASLEVRLEELMRAVKRVYASTYTLRAKRFLEATPYRLEEEKMAVILQRVVGRRHHTRFYPDFAGVARSYNYYPTAPATSEDGVAAVALGLGKMVVDGGTAVRFSPRYPRHAHQGSTVRRNLKAAQRDFYAIDLSASAGAGSPDEEREGRLFPLELAEGDGTLAPLASTYSPENDAIYDGVSRSGVRFVTFAPVLKHGLFPLAEILEALLSIARWGTRSPVELEFAVSLHPGAGAEFGFLQLRPLALAREVEEIDLEGTAGSDLLCRSGSVLGHGRLDDLKDLVVVDYRRLERRESRRVVDAVRRIDSSLRLDGRGYVLIGSGRWGSSEPLLGIPVTWDQISGARVIVEAGFEDFQVSPSQGTHFFQNLISNNVGYFTVNPEAGEGFLDWDWLRSREAVFEEGPVRHLRFEHPLVVRMNAKRHEGAIGKPSALEPQGSGAR
jgi:CheY-like chemotaxis protein